jgi:hypothetical protein
MKQQTAVEWLEEQYLKRKGFLKTSDIQQAKEMEKQQICNAWENGYDELDRAGRISLNYYKETYEAKED